MDSGFVLQCSNCGTPAPVPAGSVAGRLRCGKCGSPLIPSNCLAQEITAADWEREVLGSVPPVLVYLWSPFCGICSNYELSVRKMAASFFGLARVLMMNVVENPEPPDLYGVKGVPTLLLFSGGRLVRLLEGPQGEKGLREVLETVR